jgi:hypothetical protein
VPLYCCELCGWAFTGLRLDAMEAHGEDCPVCDGTLRLAFSSQKGRRESAPSTWARTDGAAPTDSRPPRLS